MRLRCQQGGGPAFSGLVAPPVFGLGSWVLVFGFRILRVWGLCFGLRVWGLGIGGYRFQCTFKVWLGGGFFHLRAADGAAELLFLHAVELLPWPILPPPLRFASGFSVWSYDAVSAYVDIYMYISFIHICTYIYI